METLFVAGLAASAVLFVLVLFSYADGHKTRAFLCACALFFSTLAAVTPACYKMPFRTEICGVQFEGYSTIFHTRGVAYNKNNYTVTLSSGFDIAGRIIRYWVITLPPKRRANFDLCSIHHLEISAGGKTLARMPVKSLRECKEGK